MKKILIKILPILLLIFSACDPDLSTEGVSRITYYNDIELVGDASVYIPVGSTYTEQGAIAFEGEEDVTENIQISSTVDASNVGLYSVTYTIVNTDGFEKSISRSVFVHPASDSGIDYSGTYLGEVRGETIDGGCIITKLAPSMYVASDFFGGSYCCGVRDYGLAYRLKTYFYVSDDNTTYTNLGNTSPWGPWQVLNPGISGGTILTHTVEQDGFSFDVKLVKQ